MSQLKLYISALLTILVIGCTKSDKNTPADPTYPIGLVHTRLGDMYFWLYDETPNHKAKFIELAEEKHYDDFTFNRVVKNFVIQGGCPDSVQYFENSPYLLEPEFKDSIGHVYGALGMGRDDNPEKLSNACQFYIVNKEEGLENLDNKYMIFGILIKGYNVLEVIEMEATDSSDTPLMEIPLKVSIQYFTAKKLKQDLAFDLP